MDCHRLGAFAMTRAYAEPTTPRAETETWAHADFWAFDSMRRGPMPQSLPLHIPPVLPTHLKQRIGDLTH